jgi:predicted polyphosphate/ATP-dependent NAD kinase
LTRCCLGNAEVRNETEPLIVGLVVNPVAGIGGAVGLKGTDRPEILEEALKRGGHPVSPDRSIRALKAMKRSLPALKVITCPGDMGENEAVAAGVHFDVIQLQVGERTTAADTREAAKELEGRVCLLLFAGGDGTAHDISKAVDARITVLGIPCGVKNYSGVFATSPEAVGGVVTMFMQGQSGSVDSEVLDFDEDSMRNGRIEVRISGMLRVPSSKLFMQGAKSTSLSSDEADEQTALARFVVENMDDGFQYVLGPGSTTGRVAELLGVQKTLLGVDVVDGRTLVARDVTSRQLEGLVQKRSTKLIISPIGGQGHILGRGNQQITPWVIRTIGKKNVMVICTRSKLANLPGRNLFVDTGDIGLDEKLAGYWRIVIGYREFAVVKVK